MSQKKITIIVENYEGDVEKDLKEFFDKKGFETEQPVQKEQPVQAIVTTMLHQIGVPAHLKGYQYVREAIMLAVNNTDILTNITKGLYPTIAQAHNDKPSRVERAIRHAIETAWDRGNPDILNELFGYTIDGCKGKPTNSEFIALIADKITLQLL